MPHAGRFLADILQHPKQLRLSWYMLFFQLRGLADHVLARRDFEFIRMLWRRWSPGWDIPANELEAVINTFRQPGVPAAALAYYRTALSPANLPLTPGARRESRYQVPVPTLALTGGSDRCIDSQVFQQMMRPDDFPAGLLVEEVENAGHFLQQEQPEQVTALLVQWIQEQTPPG